MCRNVFAKQVSVFLENSAGKIAELTRMLAQNGIDLVSISIADTLSFGIVRFITSSWEKAVQLVEQAGYTTRVDDVTVVAVPDRPGGLADILDVLNRAGVGVEYMYSFNRAYQGNALIVLRTNDNVKARATLEEKKIRLIGQDAVANL